MPAAPPETIDAPRGSMGLKGIWAQAANMTAVALICVLFYQDRHASLDQAKEDRALYRETLTRQQDTLTKLSEQIHEDSQKQWDAIHRLTSAILRLEKRDQPKQQEPQ